MEKKEKPKITQALLEECMKAYEEACKSGKLSSLMNQPVRSTPQGLFQTEKEKFKDWE